MRNIEDLSAILSCIHDALHKQWTTKASCSEDGAWTLTISLGDRWPSRHAAETFGAFLYDKIEPQLLAQAIGYQRAIEELRKQKAASSYAALLPR